MDRPLEELIVLVKIATFKYYMNHGSVIFNQYTTIPETEDIEILNDLAFGSVNVKHIIPLTSISGNIMVEST